MFFCDAAASGAVLFAWRNFFEKMKLNLKITAATPKMKVDSIHDNNDVKALYK